MQNFVLSEDECRKSSLKCMSLNVNGSLELKLECVDFVNLLKNFEN